MTASPEPHEIKRVKLHRVKCLKYKANLMVRLTKTLTLFVFLCLIILMNSCSHIISVSYDYDRKADLAGLKTYDWMPIPTKAEETEGFMIERIKRAVNSHLEAKGLRTTREKPDFLVATYFGKADKLRVTDWGYPYASYRRYYYYPYPGGTVTSYYYQEGTLILDFIDVKSKKLIWQGIVKAYLGKDQTPEKLDEIVNEAVKKILTNFPPAIPE